MARYTAEGVLTYVNDAYCAFAGRPRSDVMGVNVFAPPPEMPAWFPRIHPDDMAVVRNVLRHLGPTQPVGIVDHRILFANGTIRWHRWVSMAIVDADGVVREYQGVGRDITADRDLDQTMMELLDQDRRRIGQDLHDGIGQVLAGAGYILHSLASSIGKAHPDARMQVESVARHIQSALKETRRIVKDLHPVSLDGAQLPAVLCDLARDTAVLPSLRCSFRRTGAEVAMSDVAATHLYHIAQEAVANALKHAHASRIDIRLQLGARRCSLSVTDNGRGLPSDVDARPGLGLRIMRSRAQAMGGTLTVRRRPRGRRGTEVMLSIANRVLGTSAQVPDRG